MITRRQLFTWWRHVPEPALEPAVRPVAPPLAMRVVEPILQLADAAPAEPARGFSLEEFYAARARTRR